MSKNGLKCLYSADCLDRYEHLEAKQVIVSRDTLTRRSGDIDLYYVTDFFKALWAGEII